MKNNIKLLYIIRTIRSFLVMMPVIVPFFQSNGLSQTEIYILQSIYAIVIVILEIPSGYFADYVGRKESMVIGAICCVLGLALYSLSSGFYLILIAEITIGISYSFISGADTALAYDSLLALNEGRYYKRFEAYSYSLTGVGEATASFIGGFLAILSIRAPIIAQAIVYTTLIPAVLLLKEPPKTIVHRDNPFKEILAITKYALYENQQIKWLIFYGAVLGTSTYTMLWITQPYYQLVGIPIGWFGILWSIQLLSMAIFARYSEKYELWLGKQYALISFICVSVVCYMILGCVPSIITLPFILGFYFIRGVHTPILQDYVNALVSSNIRATVLSIKNLAQKLSYAILGPIIGVVVDAYSLPTALLFSGIVYGSLGVLVIYNMKKNQIFEDIN